MKTLIVSLSFLVLIILASLTVFAEKILITGKPIVLVPDMSDYSFPKSYGPMQMQYFVYFGGNYRVCFLAQKAQLASLDMLRIYITQDGYKYLWYCYRFDHRFFKINF